MSKSCHIMPGDRNPHPHRAMTARSRADASSAPDNPSHYDDDLRGPKPRNRHDAQLRRDMSRTRKQARDTYRSVREGAESTSAPYNSDGTHSNFRMHPRGHDAHTRRDRSDPFIRVNLEHLGKVHFRRYLHYHKSGSEYTLHFDVNAEIWRSTVTGAPVTQEANSLLEMRY